ncbi:MAG: YidC/Oxa1 family membrane protein insertase [Actinomycetota bacterium]|nr:YidC/Oxa1 family membrane protein insertase [Actinomycetota bacterium]
MADLWAQLLQGLEAILRFFHSLAEPLFGAASWGWAVILLTVAVRLALLPLAVKQINSMRAMQRLQPELKKIQTKYKVDRSLLRSNPEKYRERRQKQQEAMMQLYKEHNVNPAGGCLPLILQAPVFFALFSLLRGDAVPELSSNGFYLTSSLAGFPREVGPGGWLLIALMGLTTFWAQKQMMANNPTSAQQPQQKMLLYFMPVMLAFFAINLPVGVLLYWVTTNAWTMGQQWLMFRNIEAAPAAAKPAKP